MICRSFRLSTFLWLGIFLLAAAFESDTEKKVLNLEDYPLWKQIVSVELSDDGKFMSYGLRPNDGDDTLFVKELASVSETEVANGDSPKFSKDSQRVVYRIQKRMKQYFDHYLKDGALRPG